MIPSQRCLMLKQINPIVKPVKSKLMRIHKPQSAFTKFSVFILLILFFGCSNDKNADENDNSSNDGNSKSGFADGTNRSSPNGSADSAGDSKIRIDKKGQKWWNNHPYDIWFDDPLKIAANQTPLAKNSANPKEKTAATTKTTNSEKTNTQPKTQVASPGTDWKTVLPVETISAEFKNIRNTLTATMNTVGKYNSNYEAIPADATTVSVLAMILEQHPGAITWKEDVAYVRDLGLKIEEACESRGRKSYEATLKPFEQLVDILDRNKPSGLEDPEQDIEYADRVNMSSAMKRIKRAYSFLKSDVGDEDGFKEKMSQVVHEARILAAITKFISDKSYVISEEPEFLEHAKGMIDDALKIVEAGDSSNFKMFDDAIERMTNRCSQCHTAYR